MRETKFIEQNSEKWAEFEEMLRDNRKDPDKLNDLFVQITDDLSYARTFYPNRSVRVYLNGLARLVFHNIYRGKRFPKERLRLFWAQELPQVMWETRRALWLSFAIFTLAVIIGVVSSRIEPEFARTILGDSYVDMTINNIQNGDPMAVYKQREALGMSVGIAFNNLWVSLLTSLMGVLASFGTVFLLLKNGIMLGAFQYFFVERGVFWDSFLTIWIHGTLEISAIVIAGAAGLVAGSGLLFPGTFTRAQAFQRSVRRGLKIFIGLIPVFLLAAFFEGFLTRFTETPDLVRGAFIAMSLAFVLWYFVWLPWHLSRQGWPTALPDKELAPDQEFVLNYREIKTSGEILSDVFSIIKRQSSSILASIGGFSILFMLVSFTFSGKSVNETFSFPERLAGVASGSGSFFWNEDMVYLFPLQIAILTAIAFMAFRMVEQQLPNDLRTEASVARRVFSLLTIVLPIAIFARMYSTNYDFGTWWLLVLSAPFCALWAYLLYRVTPNPLSALAQTWRLIHWGTAFWIGVLVVNLGLLLFLFLDTAVFSILTEFLSLNVRSGGSNMQDFVTLILTALASSFLYLIWWVVMLSGAIQFFSYSEAVDAVSLHEQIEHIGKGRKIRGLARE